MQRLVYGGLQTFTDTPCVIARRRPVECLMLRLATGRSRAPDSPFRLRIGDNGAGSFGIRGAGMGWVAAVTVFRSSDGSLRIARRLAGAVNCRKSQLDEKRPRWVTARLDNRR